MANQTHSREIRIKVTAEHDYYVRLNVPWQKTLLARARGRKTLIIAPQNIVDKFKLLPLVEKNPQSALTIVPDGEQQKSFETFQRVLDVCGEIGIGRDGLIVGIGGGATTDLAGFVAASWLRGIDWVAIPTTVAGMVDAAIGGKTGINSRHGKNLVGAFHSPREVIIDLTFLKTLSPRDISAGLAEVVKCGFIDDGSILKDIAAYIKKKERLPSPQLIAKAVKVKARVVSQDFTESFLREILNYGHTLGHAIEKHSHYSLRHGEAISIGMIFAAELSGLTEKLSPAVITQHREILTALNLPITYSKDAWPELSHLLLGDKKVKRGRVRFVTLKRIGRTSRAEKISPATLRRAYERISQ